MPREEVVSERWVYRGKIKYRKLKSGGEKTLTALALL
jgi:hypothetical protein